MLVPFTQDEYRGMEHFHLIVYCLCVGERVMGSEKKINISLWGVYEIFSQAINHLKCWFRTQKTDYAGSQEPVGGS